MRRWLLLLVVALFPACPAPFASGEVGPWLRLEHGNAAEVSELLAIELGHRAAVEDEAPRRSPRPEVDAPGNAVRWRGSAAEVERAARVVRRLDVAREPDPLDCMRQVSTWFVWPRAKQAALAERIGGTFYIHATLMDGGCTTLPVCRCTPDPAHDVMQVRGDAWAMSAICKWMQDARGSF